MSEHRALVRWEHSGGPFVQEQYSRAHRWTFDGGLTVPAAASPSIVPQRYTDASAVDPEEAYVAAIASCHMLVFLGLAAQAGFEVRAYEDAAVGRLAMNERGVPWVSVVTLSPRVTYADGRGPDAARETELHHRAHEGCFIANSIRTEVRVEHGAP